MIQRGKRKTLGENLQYDFPFQWKCWKENNGSRYLIEDDDHFFLLFRVAKNKEKSSSVVKVFILMVTFCHLSVSLSFPAVLIPPLGIWKSRLKEVIS